MTLPQGIYDNDYPDDDSRSEGEVARDLEKDGWARAKETVVFSFHRLPRITPERAAELRAMDYRAYLRTPEWKTKRDVCLHDSDYRCERCGRGAGQWLQVHHVTYANLPYELRGDLRVMCRQCHIDCHPEVRERIEREAEAAPPSGDPFRVEVVPFRVAVDPFKVDPAPKPQALSAQEAQ